jgi:acyl carrier protein
MNKNEIETTVRNIIIDKWGLSESEVTPDSHMKDDLGADSLDIIELSMKVEEVFSMKIPDEEADQFVYVKDVVDYIDSRLNPVGI